MLRIEAYQPQYREAFRRLNEEWITQYFKLEKPDREALENPEAYILDKGGFIFVAILEDKPVGVCALMWREDLDCYELAKMAVSPEVQGKSIGYKLGTAVLDKARALHSKRVYLESNTILTPAIRLYEKLGFERIEGPATPYERCNIQMQIEFRE